MNSPTGYPDLVQILADYFCLQDLTLNSMALAGPEDSTAYRRAIRYFVLRDAFGVPRTCDQPNEAREHILRGIYRRFAEAPAVAVNPPRELERCPYWTRESATVEGKQCAKVKGHDGSHSYIE
jgi:hypothetical protein